MFEEIREIRSWDELGGELYSRIHYTSRITIRSPYVTRTHMDLLRCSVANQCLIMEILEKQLIESERTNVSLITRIWRYLGELLGGFRGDSNV